MGDNMCSLCGVSYNAYHHTSQIALHVLKLTVLTVVQTFMEHSILFIEYMAFYEWIRGGSIECRNLL